MFTSNIAFLILRHRLIQSFIDKNKKQHFVSENHDKLLFGNNNVNIFLKKKNNLLTDKVKRSFFPFSRCKIDLAKFPRVIKKQLKKRKIFPEVLLASEKNSS